MKSRKLLVAAALLIPTGLFAGGPITIGASLAYLWHPVHAAMNDAAKKTAGELGVTIVSLAANDTLGQASNLRDLIAQKVDGIILSPIDTDSLVPDIERAVSVGIPVVTVDRKANTDKVLAHVGADDVEGGRMAARFIIEKLSNSGTVIELEGQEGSSPAIDRKKGFDEVINSSGVKLLASQSAGFDSNMAFEVMARLMKKYPTFDAVFAANDDMILGAISAMRLAKIDPSKKVTVGWDASFGGLDAIQQGKLGATIDAFPGEQASRALTVLVDYIRNGKKPEGSVIYVPVKLITSAP